MSPLLTIYTGKNTWNSISRNHFLRFFSDTGLRVHSSSNENDKNYPLLVVVKQQKGILSWQIPFFIKRQDARGYDRYNTVNRTLCPIENNPEELLQSV